MTTLYTTGKALADALGCSKQRISQLRKFDWFPPPPWDLGQVRDLIEKHRRRPPRGMKEAPKRARKAKNTKKEPVSPVSPSETPVKPAPIVMTKSGAGVGSALNPVERAEWLLESMAGALEAAIEHQCVSRNDVEHVIKAVDALRKAHKDYPEIRKRRGELVEYHQAEGAVGWVVMMLLQGIERVKGKLGQRVVQLCDREDWRSKPIKLRVLDVQAVIDPEFDQLRRVLQGDVEREIRRDRTKELQA